MPEYQKATMFWRMELRIQHSMSERMESVVRELRKRIEKICWIERGSMVLSFSPLDLGILIGVISASKI